MSKEKPKSKEDLFKCPDCGLHYRSKELVEACEKACNTGACDEDITKQSVERSRRGTGTVPEAGLSPDAPDFEAKWKRALADYQNLQKEFAKEREKMRTWALQDVVEQLLPILDNFSAAQAALPAEALAKAGKPVESWAQGVSMVKKQMEDILTDFGVKKIETVGKPFDPSCMEAVGEEESAVSGQESGVVSRETLPGYRLGDTVIRPAKVILAAGK